MAKKDIGVYQPEIDNASTPPTYVFSVRLSNEINRLSFLRKPSYIVMNDKNVPDIFSVTYAKDFFDKIQDIQYMGIDVLRSKDIPEGEFKLLYTL